METAGPLILNGKVSHSISVGHLDIWGDEPETQGDESVFSIPFLFSPLRTLSEMRFRQPTRSQKVPPNNPGATPKSGSTSR